MQRSASLSQFGKQTDERQQISTRQHTQQARKFKNVQEKKTREIDLFDFMSFLAWTFLNFLASCEIINKTL